jgi:WhiB family transcriptional regulator, redox-sensing transcriptional regulator
MADITPENWRAAGACLTADPDLFFPISPSREGARQAQRALRVCAGCPVQRPCLEFAMRTGQKEGIWGGTTPAERIRVQRGATVPAALPRRRLGALASWQRDAG